MTRADARYWAGAAATLALCLLAIATVRNEYVFYGGYVVLQFVVLATAWNILGGYAGYVNFGTAAFFGAGVYTSVAMIKLTGAPLPLLIAIAASVGAVLGLVTGLLTLRLRGIFYSIATVAVAIILETVVVNWRFVGGATGIQVMRPPVSAPFESYTKLLFFVMTLLAIGATAIARYIEVSWIGRGLRAIRDSERAAEACGVPTLRLKLFACVVSGALMSAAGAPLAMYQSFVEPASTFNLNYSVSALAMPMIGGTSHWIGPVLGAVLLGSVQQIVSVTISSELNIMVLGALLVVFVTAAPAGILGLAQAYARRRRARTP
jgi:branched-chain amino acid transport system permease protein